MNNDPFPHYWLDPHGPILMVAKDGLVFVRKNESSPWKTTAYQWEDVLLKNFPFLKRCNPEGMIQ